MRHILAKSIIAGLVGISSLASNVFAQAVMTITSDGVQGVLTSSSDGPIMVGNGVVMSPMQSNGDGAGGNFTFKNGSGISVGSKGISLDQIQQKMDDSLRDALGFSDAEWNIILPRIRKVQLLQSAIGERSSSVVAIRSSGDSPVPVPESVTIVRAKARDFDKLVRTEGSSEALMKQAMASLREARAKVRVELARERKDLTELLTPKQEAILYQRAILEQ